MQSSATSGTSPAQEPGARLALFDLDYTLLPIDSDYEWARLLIRLGVVDGAEYERRNDQFFARSARARWTSTSSWRSSSRRWPRTRAASSTPGTASSWTR